MALSAGTARKRRNIKHARKGYAPVGTSVALFPGALVLRRESDNRLILPTAVTGTTAGNFVGVYVGKTATGAADGSTIGEYMWDHVELITARTALSTSYIGAVVVAYDDDQVQQATAVSAAKRSYIGTAVDFDDNGDCWVHVDPGVAAKTSP